MPRRTSPATCAVLAGALCAGLLFACVSPAPLRETSPVRIGIYADLSSTGAGDGADAVRGATLRVNLANDAGGLGGRRVELVPVDARQSTADAVKAFSRLAQQEGACAVIGAAGPGVDVAVSPVADLSRVALVSLGMDDRVALPDLVPGQPDKTGSARRYAFLAQASAAQSASAMAAYAAAHLPASRYATLYDAARPLSVLQARSFESAVRRLRGQLVASVPMAEGDLPAVGASLHQSGAEAVYICASTESAARAARAVRAAVPSMILLGNQAWGPPMASVAGAAVNGAWFTAPYAPDDPSLREAGSPLSARSPEDFRPYAAAAWDAVSVILAAVRKAGTSNPVPVRDALEQASGFKILQGTLDMDRATHRPLNPVVAVMHILDGEYRTDNPRYVLKGSRVPQP